MIDIYFIFGVSVALAITTAYAVMIRADMAYDRDAAERVSSNLDSVMRHTKRKEYTGQYLDAFRRTI